MAYSIRPISRKDFNSVADEEARQLGLFLRYDGSNDYRLMRPAYILHLCLPFNVCKFSFFTMIEHDGSSIGFIDTRNEKSDLGKNYFSAILERLNGQHPSQ